MPLPASMLTHPTTTRINRKRVAWPEWAIQYVEANYQEKGDSEIAEDLTNDDRAKRTYNAKQVEKKREALSLKRNPDQLNRILLRNKAAGRFQRSADFVHSRAVEEGDVRVWKERSEDGSIRESKRIKIGGKLIRLSTYTWEQAYGPVPLGSVVTFRDGNPLNCVLDNLLIMTRAENIARNRNLASSQERQREANQTRHAQQRQEYLDLKGQLDTVEKRLTNLKDGERDESYTVDLLDQVQKELNQRKKNLLLALYRLPESVKTE